MKKSSMRRGGAVLAIAVAVSGAGTAMAGGGPRSSDVVATIRLVHDPAEDRKRTCTGADGDYEEIRSISRGTMTSPDPRLTGELTSHEQIMVNRKTLQGTILADAVLRDPVSGATKMKGRIYAVLKGLTVVGVLTGTTADGDLLVANASIAHEANNSKKHELVAVLGGPSAVPVDLALLQTPRCPVPDASEQAGRRDS